MYFLYVLSVYIKGIVHARWVWPKLGSFERPSLKREAPRFLEKSARPPSCESPRHLVQLLAIRILIANGAHGSVCGLLFTSYSCWQWRYEKIWNLWPMAQKFSQLECIFSVGNGAMNATDIGNCALEFRILISNIFTRWRLIFKGPHRRKDGTICLKNLWTSPYKVTTYRLISLSTGSISLDSSFKCMYFRIYLMGNLQPECVRRSSVSIHLTKTYIN